MEFSSLNYNALLRKHVFIDFSGRLFHHEAATRKMVALICWSSAPSLGVARSILTVRGNLTPPLLSPSFSSPQLRNNIDALLFALSICVATRIKFRSQSFKAFACSKRLHGISRLPFFLLLCFFSNGLYSWFHDEILSLIILNFTWKHLMVNRTNTS